MEDGTIQNSQIRASNQSANGEAYRARLDLAAGMNVDGSTDAGAFGAWVATTTALSTTGATPAPYIEVNLLGRPTVTGVMLQGRSDTDMWTTTFRVQYSQDRITWKDVTNAAGTAEVSKLNKIKGRVTE